ncbi:MAG: S9 family peptidase [Henriciella sp.]|nr:S9 family peptidase [Henriciella sp.]
MLRALVASLIFVCVPFTAFAQSAPQPPLEAYGKKATIRSVSMSPSGEKIAMIARTGDQDILYIYSDAEGVTPYVDLTKLSGNWVWFPTETDVIIRGYKSTRVFGYKGELDYSAAIAFNLENRKFTQLLKGTDALYPAQSGLGNIVGRLEGTNEVLMPAFTGRTDNDVSTALFKVKLNRSRGRVFKKGNKYTMDWLVDTDGTLLAREDMYDRSDRYAIYTEQGGDRRTLFEMNDTPQPPFSLLGIKYDRSALILSNRNQSGYGALVELDFSGNLSTADYGLARKPLQQIFKDGNNVVHGVEYAGMRPSYKFFDPALDAKIQAMMNLLEGFSVDIIDYSADWTQIVLRVFDGYDSPQYITYNTNTQELVGLMHARPDVPAEAVGEVMSIEYPARDGKTIPAVVTWPAGSTAETRSNLPTLIMPHGGPRAYDSMRFDWLAQYFANRGYLVIQPNFRGSSGFGSDFMKAGNGEWGGKMQDDVTDGLQAMIDSGYSDPDRTCIVGWSYGGYSALAGGAFTPDLYNCVVAVAPVTDLMLMARDERLDHGSSSYIYDYWKDMIGDPKTDADRMKDRSPVNHAEAFTAPVLLIHGQDDRIVPFEHSNRMKRALERAGKSVELIRFRTDGHSLVDSDNRAEALQAMSDFVEAHIGGQ